MVLKRNRLRAFGMAAAAALMLSGCAQVKSVAIDAGVMENPYYREGDTSWESGIEEYYFNQLPEESRAAYRELYARLNNNEDSADILAKVDEDAFFPLFTKVLADHPELFWVEPSARYQTLAGKVIAYTVEVNASSEERDAIRAQLEAAADECIAGIPEGASDYEKIKAVYEYIIDLTEYDLGSANNQNIQSVLIGHASVCAGYARTFQYILHRMGMFCTYVEGSIVNGGEHAWNIVRIDGQYYNVDSTWGDPVFAGSVDSGAADNMNYNYLCCTDAELNVTHIPDADQVLPSCTDDSLNYYKMNGLYHEYFDSAEISQIMMNSVYNGESTCVMKFGSDEAYAQAAEAIFNGGLISEPTNYLMQQTGTSSWSYHYQNDDEFRLITIFW